MSNLLYALRYLVKSRGNNPTRIISLTLGLAIGLLMFSYITYELTYDRFIPDRDRVYLLMAQGPTGLHNSHFHPIAPTLKEEMPQIESATRVCVSQGTFYNGEDYLRADMLSVDTCFFDVLDYGVVKGNPHKIFSDENNIMISESFAEKLFGDEDPVGEILMQDNRVPLTVMGIFRDIPNNTHFGKFDVLGSVEKPISAMNATWFTCDTFLSYIKLREGADIAEVEALLGDFFERHGLGSFFRDYQLLHYFIPLIEVHEANHGVKEIVMLITLIALVTLFIACMNYVLISISMLMKRGKTIAMLKVNGAGKGNIFAIFLWETFFIVLMSVALAAFLILCFEKPLESITMVPLSDLFAPERIWAPLSVILGIFLFAGLVPSRIFASIPVSIAFRGTPANRRRWKQTLIFIQLVCVTFVIVFLIINTMQYNHIIKSDYGYDRDNLAVVRLFGTPEELVSYRNELLSMSEVEGTAVGYELPISGYNNAATPARDDVTGEFLFNVRYGTIDDRYIPLMGMEMVDGRNFTPTDAGDKIIVNERYVELRGWTDSPIGKQIMYCPVPGVDIFGRRLTTPSTIVGVVKNSWAYTGTILPVIYHNTDGCNYRSGFLTIRLSGIDSGTIEAVTRKIKSFYEVQHFEVELYEALVNERVVFEKQFRDVMIVVSLVALFIAVMGLVGYLNDEMRRRGKEIAIRRVNGATRGDIIMLIARDAALVTIPAVAVGISGSWWLGSIWMQSFEQKAGLPWWVFALGGAAVILIVYVTELVKTWRTAGSNPVKMINNE